MVEIPKACENSKYMLKFLKYEKYFLKKKKMIMLSS